MILSRPRPAPIDPLLTFDIESFGTSPAVQRSFQLGRLTVARNLKRQAHRITRLGIPLLIMVIFVSAAHIVETIAGYRPAWVGELTLPEQIYHGTAVALTLCIDLVALYLVVTQNVSRRCQVQMPTWGIRFFMSLTFLLNAAFFIRYAPDLPETTKNTLLPPLNLGFVMLLPAMIPVSMHAIERARDCAESAALRMQMIVTALEEMTERGVVSNARNAMGRVPGTSATVQPVAEIPAIATLTVDDVVADTHPVTGGRHRQFTVTMLVNGMEHDTLVTRGAITEQLGCSQSRTGELIQEAIENNLIRRVGHGSYQRVG